MMINKLFSWLFVFIIVMIPCIKPVNANGQDAQFLRTVAEQYILAQFQNIDTSTTKITVQAANLDNNRNYGGRCPGYLTAELQGNEIKKTSIVKIVCKEPNNNYTIFVPVEVNKLEKSIVAARDLSKGTIIAPSDLQEQFIDNNRILSTAVNDPSILIGSKTKKIISQGSQIRKANICVVCKGDKVTIEAISHDLSLKTTGQSLEDGNLNEQVRVKNIKSGKTILATVNGPSSVIVGF